MISVEKLFDKYTKKIFKNNEEVMKFILRHPGKQRCVEGIAKEIRIAELKSSHLLNEVTLKSIVKSAVKMFAHQALHIKQDEIMSELAKIKKYEEERKAEEFQKEIDAAEIADNENFEG